jgi:hypothetical protein
VDPPAGINSAFCTPVSRRSPASLRLPTEQEETADPQQADEIYDAAGLALRVRARGLPGAELVHEQNCEYGFRRNVLGLRPYALSVAVAGLLAVSAWMFTAPGFLGRPAVPLLAALVVMESLLVAFQALLVRAPWVESAAWAYAERLLETSALPGPGSCLRALPPARRYRDSAAYAAGPPHRAGRSHQARPSTAAFPVGVRRLADEHRRRPRPEP